MTLPNLSVLLRAALAAPETGDVFPYPPLPGHPGYTYTKLWMVGDGYGYAQLFVETAEGDATTPLAVLDAAAFSTLMRTLNSLQFNVVNDFPTSTSFLSDGAYRVEGADDPTLDSLDGATVTGNAYLFDYGPTNPDATAVWGSDVAHPVPATYDWPGTYAFIAPLPVKPPGVTYAFDGVLDSGDRMCAYQATTLNQGALWMPGHEQACEEVDPVLAAGFSYATTAGGGRAYDVHPGEWIIYREWGSAEDPAATLDAYGWNPFDPAVRAGGGGGGGSHRKTRRELEHMGFNPRQAEHLQSTNLGAPTIRELTHVHGFSYRQALTLKAGVTDLKGLIRGGFSPRHAKEIADG